MRVRVPRANVPLLLAVFLSNFAVRLFYFKSKTNYKWYLECSRFNENVQDIEFYVLLSENKFDTNCKKCHVDNYGRCQFRPTGKIKDFILEECEYRGNFIFEYLETENNYDIYKLE